MRAALSQETDTGEVFNRPMASSRARRFDEITKHPLAMRGFSVGERPRATEPLVLNYWTRAIRACQAIGREVDDSARVVCRNLRLHATG
jgi:hypothetical protein